MSSKIPKISLTQRYLNDGFKCTHWKSLSFGDSLLLNGTIARTTKVFNTLHQQSNIVEEKHNTICNLLQCCCTNYTCTHTQRDAARDVVQNDWCLSWCWYKCKTWESAELNRRACGCRPHNTSGRGGNRNNVNTLIFTNYHLLKYFYVRLICYTSQSNLNLTWVEMSVFLLTHSPTDVSTWGDIITCV